MRNENINLRVKNVDQKLATSRYTNAHKTHNLLQRSAEEHALEMSPLEFLCSGVIYFNSLHKTILVLEPARIGRSDQSSHKENSTTYQNFAVRSVLS